MVKWVNNDADDHTVVSDNLFTTASHQSTKGPSPAFCGTVTLRFTHVGTVPALLPIHAQPDAVGQPVTPGPDGGIQDAGVNFGAPMMGVVTVLPAGN